MEFKLPDAASDFNLYKETTTKTIRKSRATLPAAKTFSGEFSPRDSETEDTGVLLDKKPASWLEDAAKNERLFKAHIYENENISDLDMRQHRGRLHALLADGERLALANSSDGSRRGFLNHYCAGTRPWTCKETFPESFEIAAKEVDEGEIVDFS